MGSDVTPISVKAQFSRSFRVLAARQNALCAVGRDPKDVSLDKLGSQQKSGDIFIFLKKRCSYFVEHYRIFSTHQLHSLYVYTELISSPEVAKYMGSDVTPTAIKMQYNATIRVLSRRQIALFDEGKDPLDVSLSNPKGGLEFC